MSIAVITTFPDSMYEVYAKQMLESYTKFWPSEVPLLVQLDTPKLADTVTRITRPQDAVAVGWNEEHAKFVERNKANDDPNDYRKQTTRFCHKVFAIHRAYQAVKAAKANNEPCARYLIWWDADVFTTRHVTMEDIKKCLPKEGDAVSYLGRKDWPHSECGFLAFDLDNGGSDFIEVWHGLYVSDEILKLKETHDSWAFDHVRTSKGAPGSTNLTENKPGMEIWQHSPMAGWSSHHKGPVAKQKVMNPPILQTGNIQIETRNAIPHDQLRNHIEENQKLIKNWISDCLPTKEQIVIVSAGPQMMAEDVLPDYLAGKKIVAVKHALKPLKEAGIVPWASILLDPRPHVADFVQDADPNILWFVASQVNPDVTKTLLAKGCTVWGYHAPVRADEEHLTSRQPQSIVQGGSATATRGLFVLKKLGFTKLKLFGYDLCYPDKPDLNALDDLKQPKYMEVSIGWNNPLVSLKKCFWTEPQLVAQFQEINHLIEANTFDMEAVGDGIVPFILKSKRVADLRTNKLKANIKPLHYSRLLKWNKPTKTRFSMTRLRNWLKTLLPMKYSHR